MATESPMRIVESNRAGKWVSPTRASASFESPVATDELGLLLRGHKIHKDQTKGAPNRSGSAPPSIEGSFAAYDQLQADPSYSTFYPSGMNLNPRHPSPTFSREKVQFAHHSEISGNDRRLASSGSLYMPGSSLSTHEEEPEDDMADTSTIMLGQHTLSLSGRHKSLVDLIQEDFPRTPSPVFSHVEEPVNHDVNTLSLDSLSLKVTQSPELKSGIDSAGTTDISAESAAVEDPTMGSDQLFPQKDEPTNKDGFSRSFSIIGTDSTINLHKVENCQDKQQVEFDEQDELHLQDSFSQQNPGYNIPGYQVQGSGQGANNVTSLEMQPFLHSPAVPPSLYATSAAYMTPGNSLYPNFNASGVYAPQYSGYALGSSFPPPYLTGYPSQTGFPSHFTGNPVQNLSGQSTGTPTGENIPIGSIIQNPDRYYGHHGLTIHPAYHDPLSMQYFQQFVQDPYTAQYSRLSTPGMVGSQVDSFASQNDYAAHSGSFSIPSPRNIGIPSSNYLGSPTGLGFVPQSPLGSPVLPGSPIAGVGRRYDIGFSQSSPRNSGGYGRWQGQRGPKNISDHRKHTFLEELKASGTQRIDLSDIVGRIVEFSIDQHGSRFIQQKLENCSVEEKELVFKEVLPHAPKLITDVFGNYVIQKFFEHGTYEQRKELASQLSGHMLPLSLQMYGCRVIQKALEVIEPDQKKELVLELDGHVLRCVRDQNGNHVIQKCIECLPAENIDFIISAFEGHVAILSTHPYGCRVIQRVLEHCSDDVQCRSIVNEILESACDLAQDQYGNYVIQHVLERGKPFERNKIISQLSGKILQMSQHKYASNVVEKCLEFGDAAERELLIEEILVQSEDNNSLLAMMKDQFANYVIQKILEISNNRQREILLNRIEIHLDTLKKYTYGKHIVARFEQLSGEGSGTSDP